MVLVKSLFEVMRLYMLITFKSSGAQLFLLGDEKICTAVVAMLINNV